MSRSAYPLIEWQVCGACNYACSYCIQSSRHRQGVPTAEQTGRFLDFFIGLDRSWEIKMSGGEPFVHPGFLARIVPTLIRQTPHRLSLLTNLSASPKELAQFAGLTRGRLVVVSASLHREQVSLQDFLQKALFFKAELGSEARLVVNAVLVPGQVAELERVAHTVREAGLKFFPQWMKDKGGAVRYSPDETAILRNMLGGAGPGEANLAPCYRGRRCRAGLDYLIIQQDGSAWSCRSARRKGEGKLGNLQEGPLTFFSEARACSYDWCPCTPPANRGMIEGIAPPERPR